jgi:hypothetical protein
MNLESRGDLLSAAEPTRADNGISSHGLSSAMCQRAAATVSCPGTVAVFACYEQLRRSRTLTYRL